jgi:hypothetical protein
LKKNWWWRNGPSDVELRQENLIVLKNVHEEATGKKSQQLRLGNSLNSISFWRGVTAKASTSGLACCIREVRCVLLPHNM